MIMFYNSNANDSYNRNKKCNNDINKIIIIRIYDHANNYNNNFNENIIKYKSSNNNNVDYICIDNHNHDDDNDDKKR